MAGLVPAIHVFKPRSLKDVDARHKAGHDGSELHQLSKTLAVGQAFDIEHSLHEGILLLFCHDVACEFAKFGDDFVSTGERLLAASWRVSRLAFHRAVA